MPGKTKTKASSRKRDAIVNSALEVFLELGYGDTTIDEIVKRAGGSKATIYKYFKNKEELFATVVDELVRHSPTGELNPDDSPRDALLAYAESRLNQVFTKEHIALRRLVIGEGSRFPNIAKMYYNHGPGLSHKQLEKCFKEEKTRRNIKIEDANLAATIFQSMLMHSMYLRTLFTAHGQLTRKELKQHANTVVDNFLHFYHA